MTILKYISIHNASIHGWKFIKAFIEKYQDVKLFKLPTYSPEYNPIEQVWRWIKPFVHAAKTIEKGCKEIITRFRKIMTAWINSWQILRTLELDRGIIYYLNIYDRELRGCSEITFTFA